MILLSTAVVAALTSDFIEARRPVVVPEAVTASNIIGQGDLLLAYTVGSAIGSVPRGAVRIPMGTLNLSASCDKDIRIDSIKLKHVGLGDAADITGVYLANGFRRVSRSTTFDRSSRAAEARTTGLTVPACGAVALTVFMDLSPDAAVAAEHAIALLSPYDIASSAKNITLSPGDESTTVRASPYKTGSVNVRFLPVSGRPRYGRIETIARLQLTADAEDRYILRSITLTNEEDARDMDFINLQLQTRGGTGLTLVAARMKGREVTLEFSPKLVLERSAVQVFLLRAEVRTSKYRKVRFTLLEPSDLVVAPYRSSR